MGEELRAVTSGNAGDSGLRTAVLTPQGERWDRVLDELEAALAGLSDA